MSVTTHMTAQANETFIQKRPLLSFFTLAIVITWLFALPSLRFELPFKPFQTAGAYGPLLAAVIVSAALGGDELRSLFGRMTNLRFGLRWYLLAIFGNLLLYLLVTGLSGAPVTTGGHLRHLSYQRPRAKPSFVLQSFHHCADVEMTRELDTDGDIIHSKDK